MKILARRARGLTELGHFKIWIWIRVCKRYPYIKLMLSDFQTHFWSTFQSFYADGDNQLDVKEKRASIVLDNLQLHQSGLWISLGVRAPARQVPDRSRTRTGAYWTCLVLFLVVVNKELVRERAGAYLVTPFDTSLCFQTAQSVPCFLCTPTLTFLAFWFWVS